METLNGTIKRLRTLSTFSWLYVELCWMEIKINLNLIEWASNILFETFLLFSATLNVLVQHYRLLTDSIKCGRWLVDSQKKTFPSNY